MKKMIYLLPFILLMLSGCITNGVDSTLYKDGKNIISMTNDNISSGKVMYSNSQEMQIDNFQSKYTSDIKSMKDNDLKYYHDVFMAYMAYRQYGENQESKYLDKYHKYVSELQTNYNLKIN
jgi:hypothetical protein